MTIGLIITAILVSSAFFTIVIYAYRLGFIDTFAILSAFPTFIIHTKWFLWILAVGVRRAFNTSLLMTCPPRAVLILKARSTMAYFLIELFFTSRKTPA